MLQAEVLDLVVGATYFDTAAIDETVVVQDNNFAVMAGSEVEAEMVEAARIEAARIEAERVEAERVEAERIEAAICLSAPCACCGACRALRMPTQCNYLEG